MRSFRRSTISDWSFTFSNIQSVHVQSMVCWPSIESKGSLDGHVGLVRALKPRNLLAWTYSEKVMHACLQMHVGGFGYQFRAKITLWYVPNAVFERLFTFKLINLCVLNFALDLVEFSSKLESIYIYMLQEKYTNCIFELVFQWGTSYIIKSPVTEQFPQSMPPYFHAMHACGPLVLCQGRELWESAKPGKPAWSG